MEGIEHGVLLDYADIGMDRQSALSFLKDRQEVRTLGFEGDNIELDSLSCLVIGGMAFSETSIRNLCSCEGRENVLNRVQKAAGTAFGSKSALKRSCRRAISYSATPYACMALMRSLVTCAPSL